MELKKIKINKNEYIFINESSGTRYGFKHTSKLFLNNYLLNESKINYLNRTWECYQFQTVMKRCINELINIKKESIKCNYKKENNIKRINKKDIVILNNIYKNSQTLKEYNKIYDLL